MTLPDGFQFSQGSLQDYVDCPRRFELRYLLRVAWPAPVAEPLLAYEQHTRDGEAFHRHVHQHILGLPADQLSACIGAAAGGDETGLGRWWQNYLNDAPAEATPAAGARYPEFALAARAGGERLTAKYDLVTVRSGECAMIIDWKTAAKRPRRDSLALRLQTRVYRYALVQAGAYLNGGQPWRPEQVTMVYWFADYPQDPERFEYTDAAYAADGVYLARLIGEIKATPTDAFAQGADNHVCGYCVYRSLCERGTAAADVESADEDLAENVSPAGLDFEQIGEIAF
jgi:hypothetical protein